MSNSEKLLLEGLKEHNLEDIVDEISLSRLEIFYDYMISYNKKTDLTNITEKDEVYIKHFLDSLMLFKIEEFKEAHTLVDIGTGAGFPGVPLKIINNNLDITLMDSLKKRLIFLDYIIDEMSLSDIRTLHARAEDMGNDTLRDNFEIATSRAVSRLNKLVELTLPLVAPSGIFVAMKGKDAHEELDEAENAIKMLNGRVREVIDFKLFEGDQDRSLIVIEKTAPTPKKYPRSFGKIKNKPL